MAPELRHGAYHRRSGTKRSLGDVGVRRTAKGPEAASGGKTDSARTLPRVSSCHRPGSPCDAAHLLRTVNEGITSIATVHDSFGCLASRVERFRKIIREQFVKLYQDHDVLQEILDCAREDLGENAKGLPAKPPDRGLLDIKEVLGADYAFA
jgi:Autographiviridae RNA polymerase